MKSDEPKQPDKLEPINEIFKSVQNFLQERPVKGVLQSIDEFFKQPFPHSSFNVHVSDTGENHTVTAELPGVNKEQISLNILGNSLTITVNRKDIYMEENDKNKVFRRSESFQRTSRTVPFPHPIDEKRVQAKYQDGLLTITIPKLHGKKIDIIE